MILHNEEIRLIWDSANKVLSVYCGKDIIIESVETISMKCKDFILEASNSINVKAGQSMDVTTGSDCTVDGGQSLTLNASMTMIN